MSSIHLERRRGRQSFASISKLIGYLFWTKRAGNHLDRDYAKFNKEKFISEFKAKKLKFKGHTLSTNTAYNNLIETLREMLSVHAPIKQRFIRGNQHHL